MNRNEKILQEAIKKAKSNGWTEPQDWRIEAAVNGYNYPHLIFRHDFAKALWGEGKPCEYCRADKFAAHATKCPVKPGFLPQVWQYHLQQMVIHPNPINYLGDHLYE